MTLFDLSVGTDSGRGDLQTVDGLRFLMKVDGIGPSKASKIAQTFRTLTNLREASDDVLLNLVGKPSQVLSQHRFDDIGPVSLPMDVRAISVFDDEWPESLKKLSSAPAIIYVVGSLPSVPCIAIVGTRQPTTFGLNVVEKVAKETALRKWGIVSGLAAGIDTAAHEMAIHYGTKTWAILGGGVDAPTPAANRGLAEAIVNSGGGLISEQEPGIEPNAQRLVSRNRLQVAFSSIVLAAQAGIPSGTLHTVRFAIEQGKYLVVPRPTERWADEPQSAGNIALTNPTGCNPEILSATAQLGKTISMRHPVADLVLTSADIGSIWMNV